jgi:hypothetical protein
MQVGDLVKLKDNVVPLIGSSDKLGIVMMRHNRVVPTVIVQWNGSKDTMAHRIDMLEVVSASR